MAVDVTAELRGEVTLLLAVEVGCQVEERDCRLRLPTAMQRIHDPCASQLFIALCLLIEA
jgi:hypothetical protein